MGQTLDIVTIGQAPRDDIATLFAAHAPSSTRIVLRGCLDGLSDDAIAQRPPTDGGDTLYTRLQSDRDVIISKTHVVERSAEFETTLSEADSGIETGSDKGQVTGTARQTA